MKWNTLLIEPELSVNKKEHQNASYVRKTFTIKKRIRSASLVLTACGLYKGYVNGQAVGNQVFMPGFTDYTRRLQFQSYDVTSMLNKGENVIGVILGDGWYRGKLGLFSRRYQYGLKTKLLAVLEITYDDGSNELIHTDTTWKATQDGPILKSDWKDGEIYDATCEIDGWNTVSFDDSQWHEVYPSPYEGALVPTEGEKILEHETFKPEVFITPDGSTVLDFGQNMYGYVKFVVTGKSGHTVTLQHGETLDEKGNFTLKNLSPEGGFMWKIDPLLQKIIYTLKEGKQSYKPSFTAHGFRYVKLENWPEQVRPENFTAIAIYSDMQETGYFQCSNPMINQLVGNAKWSQKSIFLDVPTDCPTRERAPWTGDISVFAEAGSYMMNTKKFLAKWLKDLALRQRDDGCVPNFIPSVGWDSDFFDGSAGWGDAAITVPFTLYTFFGDKTILKTQYDSMVKWMDFLEKRAKKSHPLSWFRKNPYRKYTIDTGYHWGEWLEPGSVMSLTIAKNIIKPDAEVATAYFAYSSKLMAEVAGILGKTDHAQKYRELHENIKKAYRYNFTKNGKVRSRRQCRYIRPVALDLLPDEEKKQNIRKLNEIVIHNNYRIGTGFLTTPFILPVLCEYGFVETAYRMIQNTERPGWLYAIRKGATTIWENWNGIDEKGVPRDSLNHFAYGAVVGWLFKYVAGIAAIEPAFKKIRIKPVPHHSLTFVKCSFDSPSGIIKSEWTIIKGQFTLKVEVPVAAEVIMPDDSHHQVTGGIHTFSCKL
ncbi:MAG: family 78 glycoside hydrolase catalytic domain [Spirochaetota bacterium]